MPRVIINSLSSAYDKLTDDEKARLLSYACQSVSEVKGLAFDSIEGWWAPVQGVASNPDSACIEVYYSVSVFEAIHNPAAIDQESERTAELISARISEAQILPPGSYGVWVMPIIGGAYRPFQVEMRLKHRKVLLP